MVIAPRGEVDLETVGALRAALEAQRGSEPIVLDMRGGSFVDCGGLALVVEEQRWAQREGSSCAWCAAPRRSSARSS